MWFRQEFRSYSWGFPHIRTSWHRIHFALRTFPVTKTSLVFYHCHHIAVVKFSPINLSGKNQTFYFATREKCKTYSALTHLMQIAAWVERRLWWRKAHASSICKNTGRAQQHPTDPSLFRRHKLTNQSKLCVGNMLLFWPGTSRPSLDGWRRNCQVLRQH